MEHWAQIDLIGLLQQLGVVPGFAPDSREAAHAANESDGAVQRVEVGELLR